MIDAQLSTASGRRHRKIKAVRASLCERLWRGSLRVGSCWVWQRSKNDKGYGTISVASRRRLVHVVAYELLVEPVPEGYELDHTCRNRACWNPSHLEPVTHAENMARGERAQRTHCKRGHSLADAWIGKSGNRHCRRCQRARRHERSARR